MIYLSYALNFFIMLLAPFLLARLINARRKTGWGLFGVGAVTFILSQFFHIPFNWLILRKLAWVPTDTAVPSNLIALAIFAGLSAGLFEESARYLTYRFWAKDARSWGKGLMLGVGHGGIEAILLAILGAWGVFQLTAFSQGYWLNLIPAEQMALVEEQITAVFSVPWYRALLGALERLFALAIHLSLSLLVMQGFVRKKRRWLILAILWHALIDALAVFSLATWNVYLTEAIVGGTAVISLIVIYYLRSPEPVEAELEPLPEIKPPLPLTPTLSSEALDRSRFANNN